LPDARDAMITSVPDQWKSPTSGDIDLVVPQGVVDWMHEHVWEQSHDAWHNIRRCKTGGLLGIPGAPPGGSGAVNVCSHTDMIPDHQECQDADDGFAFLVTHRHMLTALKQLFPQHADLFAGFPHFPYNATDVPQLWQSRWGTGWSQQILSVANTLEAIE